MSGGLVFDPLCAWCGGGGRVRAPWPNIGLSCHCGKRPKDTPKAPEPAATPPVDLENARRQLDDVRAMSTIKRSNAWVGVCVVGMDDPVGEPVRARERFPIQLLDEPSEELVSVVANAIGWAMFSQDGREISGPHMAIVTTDEETRRVVVAAERALDQASRFIIENERIARRDALYNTNDPTQGGA